MIVRILGEGQYEIPDTAHEHLDRLDATLDAAVEAGDDGAFTSALHALIEEVRRVGTAIDATRIVPSDLALPAPESNLGEVLALLETEANAES